MSEQADTELESMSAICPLTDDYLPLDAGSLKNKQVSPNLAHSFDMVTLTHKRLSTACNVLHHIRACRHVQACSVLVVV